jgi:hypothetical protein
MAFQQINIEELRLGMYVKLGCSWWKHPFTNNQFKVTNKKDLSTIRNISNLTLNYDPDLSDPEVPDEISIEDTTSLPQPSANRHPRKNLRHFSKLRNRLLRKLSQACNQPKRFIRNVETLEEEIVAKG